MISKRLKSLIFSLPIIFGISVLIPLSTYELGHGAQGAFVLLMYVIGFLLGTVLSTFSFWLENHYNIPQRKPHISDTSTFKVTKVKYAILAIIFVLFVISAWLIMLYSPFAKVGFTMVVYGYGFLFGTVVVLITIRYLIPYQDIFKSKS